VVIGKSATVDLHCKISENAVIIIITGKYLNMSSRSKENQEIKGKETRD